MRILVNDWAWYNCVRENKPMPAVLPWGYAVTFEDGLVSCYRTLDCKKLRETEKAVQFEYQAPVFGRNCVPTGKVLNWKVWLPKSCIKDYFESDSDLWYNGGQYDLVESRLAKLASEGWKAKYSSIVKDTLIPIAKTK
jgi:hypothetical protein